MWTSRRHTIERTRKKSSTMVFNFKLKIVEAIPVSPLGPVKRELRAWRAVLQFGRREDDRVDLLRRVLIVRYQLSTTDCCASSVQNNTLWSLWIPAWSTSSGMQRHGHNQLKFARKIQCFLIFTLIPLSPLWDLCVVEAGHCFLSRPKKRQRVTRAKKPAALFFCGSLVQKKKRRKC